jgi:hypothetical protein
MRAFTCLTLGLALVAVAQPAYAGKDSNFVSMQQCENFLNRWRDSLVRPNSDSVAYLLPIYQAAYCAESSNGRYNVVWPG